jgi:hypothetical protein
VLSARLHTPARARPVAAHLEPHAAPIGANPTFFAEPASTGAFENLPERSSHEHR